MGPGEGSGGNECCGQAAMDVRGSAGAWGAGLSIVLQDRAGAAG